jgi:hypothetical protein
MILKSLLLICAASSSTFLEQALELNKIGKFSESLEFYGRAIGKERERE